MANSKNVIIKQLLQETSQQLNPKSKKKPIKVSSKKPGLLKQIPTQKQIRTKREVAKKESDSEDDTPIAVRLANKRQNEPKNVIFPHISRGNWNKFERKLKEKEVDEVTKKLNACLARMHGFETYDTHFTSLHFVRLAIVDSILHRKWDNLLRLTVMLGRNYTDPVFTMFIRHLCQILKHYHPAIRGTEFENQIDLIGEKYDRKRDKRSNVNNTI